MAITAHTRQSQMHIKPNNSSTEVYNFETLIQIQKGSVQTIQIQIRVLPWYRRCIVGMYKWQRISEYIPLYCFQTANSSNHPRMTRINKWFIFETTILSCSTNGIRISKYNRSLFGIFIGFQCQDWQIKNEIHSA